MISRKITGLNKNKHFGHACEGHLRGLLLHIPSVNKDHLSRALPFQTAVESDAILLNPDGKIRAIFVVAFWEHAGSSEKKLYRTRTEYNEIACALSKHPDAFAKDFKVVTVVYGSESGWKAKVLGDLRQDCAPVIFLPDLLGKKETKLLAGELFRTYCVRWEAGADARKHVEDSVAGRALSAIERKLLAAVMESLRRKGLAVRETVLPACSVRLPEKCISSRYRQALGVLSLFSDEEIGKWHHFQSPLETRSRRTSHVAHSSSTSGGSRVSPPSLDGSIRALL